VSCTFEDSEIPGEWQGVLLAQTLWLLGPLLTEAPSASQESNTLREHSPLLCVKSDVTSEKLSLWFARAAEWWDQQ
jgi:hypothetical protein